jgi:hypothetical protein
MMTRKLLIVLSLMILIMMFALATVPNSCKRAYELGTGREIMNILESLKSENLQLDQMSDTERAPYIAQAKKSGFQFSIYMLLGQYIPFYLFIVIIISQLSRPTSRSLRVFLWISFLLIWLIGWFFLSLVSRHWNNCPYSDALGGALIIYIAAAIFFGIIIGIGRLFQHLFRKKTG